MGAETAQKVVEYLSRSATSQCVAYEAFEKGLEKIFGEYRFVHWDIKIIQDLKKLNPFEVDEVCGGYMCKVPKGWPLGMLKSHRHFRFTAMVYCFESGETYDVKSDVRVDLYGHPQRNGWDATHLTFSYSRTECEKKEEKEYKVIRESTPTGWWKLASLKEKRPFDYSD